MFIGHNSSINEMNCLRRHKVWKEFKRGNCDICFYPFGCGLKWLSVEKIMEHCYYKKLVEEIEKRGKCRLFTQQSA